MINLATSVKRPPTKRPALLDFFDALGGGVTVNLLGHGSHGGQFSGCLEELFADKDAIASGSVDIVENSWTIDVENRQYFSLYKWSNDEVLLGLVADLLRMYFEKVLGFASKFLEN